MPVNVVNQLSLNQVGDNQGQQEEKKSFGLSDGENSKGS